jgi:hypothetical protein
MEICILGKDWWYSRCIASGVLGYVGVDYRCGGTLWSRKGSWRMGTCRIRWDIAEGGSWFDVLSSLSVSRTLPSECMYLHHK